ncbi:MAG: hypothetical protein F2518_06455, partial [Actinobacteria bacterium]|nr:hypothetical protein [Actinomycetota bacterium]
MFDSTMHATFVSADPARMARLAFWSDPDGSFPDEVVAPRAQEPLRVVLPTLDGISQRTVTAEVFEVSSILDQLVGIHLDDPSVSPSVQAWAVVARTALELIAKGRLQPAISPSGFDAWAIGPLDEQDRQARAALAGWIPPTAHCCALDPVTSSELRMMTAEDAVMGMYAAIADSLPRTGAAGTVSRQRAWHGHAAVDVSSLRSYLVGTDAVERTIVGLRLSLP